MVTTDALAAIVHVARDWQRGDLDDDAALRAIARIVDDARDDACFAVGFGDCRSVLSLPPGRGLDLGYVVT